MHYSQILRHKKILERTIFDPNEIIDCGTHYEICLYNKQCKEIGRALIDKEDLDKVKGYKWHLTNKKYVISNKCKLLLLHHLIIGKPPRGYEVDHRFGNKLDNRKQNLRFATHSQNMMNKKSKRYFWNKKKNRWQVEIKFNHFKIYIGRFTNEQDAINARKEAEQKYYKEFAYKEKETI